MKKAGIATNRELFNNAISLFEWAAKERVAGRSIVSIDPTTVEYREVVIPVLEALAKTTKAEREIPHSPADLS